MAIPPKLPPVSPRDTAVALAAVALLWALTLLLVSPRGGFPLNDDWIYAQAVRDWIDTGHYTGHPFTSASLVGQACWGKAFSSLFGFSFETLRWSTLVLWLAAALAVSRAALELRAAPFAAALAGGLVIANPIAMNLGYTFMTDVPFMAACALAGVFYLRALADPRPSLILAGSLFAAWGLLIRQFAVLLPLAFLLATTPLLYRIGRRESTKIILPALLPLFAAWGLLQYLAPRTEKLNHPWMPYVLGESAPEIAAGALKFCGVAMVYIGLFALPLVAAAAFAWLRARGSRARRLWGLTATLPLVAVTVAWSAPRRIPFLGNMLFDTGVGPLTLRGDVIGGVYWRPVSIGDAWWLPTILGIAAAAWMLAGWLGWLVMIPGDGRRPLRDPRRRRHAFLMLWAALMIGALYHPGLPVRFDRYFLGALVPVLLLLAAATPRARDLRLYAVQLALAAALYTFSLISLQDYLAWNSARWHTLQRLMAGGVPPENIDGGYEFNGWYTSPHFIARDGDQAFYHAGPLGWWVLGDEWAIAGQPRAGYNVVETIPYHSWLAGNNAELFLLRRNSQVEPSGVPR